MPFTRLINKINIWRCKMQIEINEAELKEWAVNQLSLIHI